MSPDVFKTFSVEDKVVIITGGAGFLGMQYALALGKAGARIMIWDNCDIDRLQKCSECLQMAGIVCQCSRVDVTDEAAVIKEVSLILEYFGRIDVLINNAAMNPAVGSDEVKNLFVPIEDYSTDLFRKELKINLVGMFICIKVVVPIMKKQGKGVIVNVASEVSNIAHDHRVYNQSGKYKSPAYVASKTGVVGLTRACAAQLGEFGIRVNAISPGGVRTDKMPPDFVERFGKSNMLSRMAESDEYCAAMMYLCSDASSFMTGANLTIDGGKSAW